MTENFFKLPNWVIGGDIELTPYEIVVCAVIGRHRNNTTGESFPGMATIAKEGGMSKPTAIAAVKSLREKGVISVRVEGESHRQKFHYRFSEEQETGQCGLPVNEETGKGGLPVNDESSEETGKPDEPVLVETGKPDATKPVNHVYPNKTYKQDSFNKREESALVPTKSGGQGETASQTPPPAARSIVESEIPEGLTPVQYANGLLRKCYIPQARDTQDAVSNAIEAYAGEHAIPLGRATADLIKIALADRESGVTVGKYWFLDGKYNNSKHNKRKLKRPVLQTFQSDRPVHQCTSNYMPMKDLLAMARKAQESERVQ
jgi:hypothetical protein